MRFAAIIDYSTDQELIGRVRPKHREYLGSLLENGQLFASGPFTDDGGALIIYEADTAEAAEALLKADPFHEAGVFLKWTIRPWKVVMANPELFTAG